MFGEAGDIRRVLYEIAVHQFDIVHWLETVAGCGVSTIDDGPTFRTTRLCSLVCTGRFLKP